MVGTIFGWYLGVFSNFQNNNTGIVRWGDHHSNLMHVNNNLGVMPL
jgi:hypothetical protein